MRFHSQTMKTVQQWVVTVALASIGVMVMLIILSAQLSSADSPSLTRSPNQFNDQQQVFVETPLATSVSQPTLAPAATSVPAEREHVVAAGDTMGNIATQYGCTLADVVAYNQLADPNVLAIGQVIKIPTCQ